MESNKNPSSTNFSSLPILPSLIQSIQELGFETLTPIQAQSIPILLEGKDLIGQSKTGSGKTAAFAIPLLNSLNFDLIQNTKAQALILCPTRELGSQVAREIRKLGRHQHGLRVLILSGGEPVLNQKLSLQKGAHILVGTPGRILDLLNRRLLDSRSIKTLVLDEADRMLDMGFQNDMERILKSLPTDRQTILFSATFPPSIETISKAYQKNPVRVTIAGIPKDPGFLSSGEENSASIRQMMYETQPDTKLHALLWLLQQNLHESIIVFCNQKLTVTQVTESLHQANVSVDCLHGDLEQRDRDRVMAKFRNKSTRVLIATDVAARGIDIENLDAVLNYDLPPKPEIYVHRIGRTGRAGKKGLAISFYVSREKHKIKGIENYTGVKLVEKKIAALNTLKIENLSQAHHADASMATLSISGGRKDKVRPGDILGALTGEAGGLKGTDIGKIEIHDHFSYVAISKNIAEMVLKKLNQGKIKGRKFRVQLVK